MDIGWEDVVIAASIAGASGYAGGELLRLLLGHPDVEVRQATSSRFAGKFVQRVHPNLRGASRLRFVALDELAPCDVLFLCLPHGESSRRIDYFRALAAKVVDLSADFRLDSPEEYERFYGHPHPRPELLGRFVGGIAEIHRRELATADLVACAGCNATAAILALRPLYREGVAEGAVVDLKVGSSAAGNRPSQASHHPERAGALRSYKPTGHRHVAEIRRALGAHVHLSATAVERVRGILATCHVKLNRELDDKVMWRIYRRAYGSEPFVRIVKERAGIHRYPDPSVLAGSNHCDVGFELDPLANRVVVMSAIDNLMKGAAGQAVQAFNIMHDLPERKGMTFPGLHPA